MRVNVRVGTSTSRKREYPPVSLLGRKTGPGPMVRAKSVKSGEYALPGREERRAETSRITSSRCEKWLKTRYEIVLVALLRCYFREQELGIGHAGDGAGMREVDHSAHR